MTQPINAAICIRFAKTYTILKATSKISRALIIRTTIPLESFSSFQLNSIKDISDGRYDCTDYKNDLDFPSHLLNGQKWSKKAKFFRNFRNKSCSILMLQKNRKNKKCAPKLILFNEKKKKERLG